VPDYWEAVPLGHYFIERKETVSDVDYYPLSVTKQGIVPQLEDVAKTDAGDTRKLVRAGDIAINSRSDRKGSSGLSEYDGSVSVITTVMTPRGINPRFAHHLIRSVPFQEEFYRWGSGIVADLWSTRWSAMKQIVLAVPPIAEQQAIADYLDRETAEIDAFIADQERLVRLVHERRRTTVVACQDSSGTREVQLCRVLRPMNRPALGNAGVITAYRDGQVTLRSRRREDGYTFAEHEQGYQGVEPGDLVFHGLDGFAGAIGVSDSRGNASPVYHVCQAIDGDDVSYVAVLLQHLAAVGYLATQASSVRQRAVDFRNWHTLGSLRILLPPPEVQREAVASIRYDAMISEDVHQSIALLRERRSALITAAVTGQINVTTGHFRNVSGPRQTGAVTDQEVNHV